MSRFFTAFATSVSLFAAGTALANDQPDQKYVDLDTPLIDLPEGVEQPISCVHTALDVIGHNSIGGTHAESQQMTSRFFDLLEQEQNGATYLGSTDKDKLVTAATLAIDGVKPFAIDESISDRGLGEGCVLDTPTP